MQAGPSTTLLLHFPLHFMTCPQSHERPLWPSEASLSSGPAGDAQNGKTQGASVGDGHAIGRTDSLVCLALSGFLLRHIKSESHKSEQGASSKPSRGKAMQKGLKAHGNTQCVADVCHVKL